MIFDIISAVANMVDSGQEMNRRIDESERQKNAAISQSNKSTAGKVAGITALGAIAALGISMLSDNKNDKNSSKAKTN